MFATIYLTWSSCSASFFAPSIDNIAPDDSPSNLANCCILSLYFIIRTKNILNFIVAQIFGHFLSIRFDWFSLMRITTKRLQVVDEVFEYIFARALPSFGVFKVMVDYFI